jgi:serine protease Do
MKRSSFLPILAASGLAFGSFGCQNHVAQAAGAQPPVDLSAPAPFSTPPVLAGTADVATLAARVKPAVVNITTVHEMRRPRMDVPEGFPFNFFGGQLPRGRQGGGGGGDEVMKQQALGSGFLVDRQGHVVTNAHVIDDADTVKVTLSDEREYTAKVIGKDPRLDIAVLQVQNPTELPEPVALGSSDALRVGEYVVAIGNPFGLGDTVTMGIVSAKGRTIGAGPYDDFIQTDASINPGNSGGPLFNLRGQVVGINTAINPNGKGIGFAIPVDEFKEVVNQLMTTGKVARGRMGVMIQPVDAALAKALGMNHARGALVGEVEADGPGAKAGLLAGDVIEQIDQTEVPHSSELPRIVARHAPGSTVNVKLLRSGHEQTVAVTLAALKEEKVASNDDSDDDDGPNAGSQAPASHKLGIQVADAPGGGALVERVKPGSPADGELAAGDVIVEVNHSPLSHAAELAPRVAAAKQGQPLLLRVKREDHLRFVAIEL